MWCYEEKKKKEESRNQNSPKTFGELKILIADIRLQKKTYQIGQQGSGQMNADDGIVSHDNRRKLESEPQLRTATDDSMRMLRLRRSTVS